MNFSGTNPILDDGVFHIKYVPHTLEDKEYIKQYFWFMKNERIRLESFRNGCNYWPHRFISPEDLANAGFFYLTNDRVQCAFCRGILSNWSIGDNAFREHCRHYPLCPFLMEAEVGNIPIDKVNRGHDVCDSFKDYVR